jgi:hypothetical protein
MQRSEVMPAEQYQDHYRKIIETLDDEGDVTLKEMLILQDLGFKDLRELMEASLQLHLENGKTLKQLNKRSK